jgi:hypothetical protein
MKQMIAISMLAAFGYDRIASAQASGGVEKTYELVNASPTVNEPVIVKYTVTNHLPTAVTNSRFFDEELTRPDGRRASGPPAESPDYFGPVPGIRLEPSESRSFLVLMNKWFYFDVPGRYMLNITDLTVKPGLTETETTNLPSVRLTIDVGTRNPVRLNQVCDRLEEAVVAGPPAESYSAAEALAYVGDPVAVPHIARVLAADYRAFRWMLFPALRRIGTAEAAETLISYLSSPDEEARIEARGNLGRIMENTSDPAIRARIKAFLP